MDALSTSTTQIFFKHNTNKGSSASSRNSVWLPNRPTKGLIQNPLRLFSSTISCTSSDTQIDVLDTEVLTEETYESNTVHVKFQLRKECSFGQHFLLVGDDPIIGLWNPARGIPLSWSDEHIWTVELDLPIGKSLLFKFILKRAEHDIFWQPGPDRILETWETKNTIVVSEDWENANIQKITEEPSKEMITCSDIYLNIAENISYPVEEPVVNEKTESVATENIVYMKEVASANAEESISITEDQTNKEHNSPVKPQVGSLVAENIFDVSDIIKTDMKLAGTQDADLVGYVGEPILVPGLILLSDVGTEEGFFVNREISSDTVTLSETDEAEEPGLTPVQYVGGEICAINQESNNTLDASSRTDEDPGMPEPYENKEQEEQNAIDILNEGTVINKPKEETGTSELGEKNQLEEEYRHSDDQQAPREVWQNDFNWGRKTLNKLLATLGFPLDQT